MQKWEYMLITIYGNITKVEGGEGAVSNKDSVAESVNALGEKGWDIASAVGSNNANYSLILKRPKQ